MEIDQGIDTTDNTNDTAPIETTATPESAPIEDAALKWDGKQKLSEKSEEELNRTFGQNDIPELEKLAKFKMNGKEMSYKDLQAMVLSQQKFTQKSQALAQQQKQFEQN